MSCRGGLAALVFDGVVQEGGDGGVFVAAPLQDRGGHRHQVGDVGDVVAFAGLRFGAVARRR